MAEEADFRVDGALKTYMVLFRSGAGVSGEASAAAVVQLAKAQQRALGRTKKELKVERVVERAWEDEA